MYGRYNRLLALFDARDTSLERVNVSPQPRCCSCAVEGRIRLVGGEGGGVLRSFLDVETGGEGFGAGAGEDDGAGGGGGGKVGEEGGKFEPHSMPCQSFGKVSILS